MTLTGSYELHVYCDGPRHKELHPDEYAYGGGVSEFGGRTFREAMGAARDAGWLVSARLNAGICPTCRDHGARLPRKRIES